jgi:ATP-dependent Clp protease ATP-binding subunit ClpA
MYERFTDRARKVMQLANQEAQRFNHEHIRTEHVLLGLVKEGSGVAANVLKNLDVDLATVRSEVEKLVPCAGSEKSLPGRLPPTPRTKRVINHAIEEARNLNHNYVGTEHLLLGLLRSGEGVAVRVLTNIGLKLDTVREEVMNLLGHNTPMVAGAAPDQPEEVHYIGKSLKPGDVETYSVSELAPEAPNPPVPLTDEQRQLVRDLVRDLTEQKDAFTAALDFVRAARCAAEVEALAQLLAWNEWYQERL